MLYIYLVQPGSYSISQSYCISFLILESIEKDLIYLLESPDKILRTFFVKLLLGREVGQIRPESRAYTLLLPASIVPKELNGFILDFTTILPPLNLWNICSLFNNWIRVYDCSRRNAGMRVPPPLVLYIKLVRLNSRSHIFG
jgi:hypothetical protein